LNNGICKNLNKISCRFPYEVKSANQFATMKNVRITKLGISASNDFTTVGGTPSGILIVQPLRISATNILAESNATTIPKNRPLEPIQRNGRLPTSYTSVEPSGVKVVEKGVTIKN